MVNADGSFTPMWTYVRDGDIVEWVLHDRTDSIIPAQWSGKFPAVCSTPMPYYANDPNNFTGPMPRAPGGVFALSPMDDPGLEVTPSTSGDPCPGRGRAKAVVGTDYLCATGAEGATMASTWEDPNITGVFIRLKWNQINPSPGVFDFTILEREMNAAVRNGKLFSLVIKAGNEGTPDWIFSTDSAEEGGAPRPGGGGGVTRLTFQDGDSGSQGCGPTMDLGNPTEPVYETLYLDMLSTVAAYIKTRADWYRALAYIKPSGANLFSAENRLPKNCPADVTCICNTEVWAKAGYTPTGLLAFYKAQTRRIAEEFPGKTMSYQLIQAGFPLVNDAGDYLDRDGHSSGGALPGGTQQTRNILDQGQADYGTLFAVQHNGLGPAPAPGTCPGGPGCPNKWVTDEGHEGQYTGFQTNNAHEGGVRTPADVESAFQNAWDNSDATFVEIYEQRLWEIENQPGGLLPSGDTVGAWNDDFDARQRATLPPSVSLGSLTHRHTFKRTITTGRNKLLSYIHGSKCGVGNATYGVIAIRP
jgi:hypothetical protein